MKREREERAPGKFAVFVGTAVTTTTETSEQADATALGEGTEREKERNGRSARRCQESNYGDAK